MTDMLRACTRCSRHVDADDETCPFCDASMANAGPAFPAPPMMPEVPPERLPMPGYGGPPLPGPPVNMTPVDPEALRGEHAPPRPSVWERLTRWLRR